MTHLPANIRCIYMSIPAYFGVFKNKYGFLNPNRNTQTRYAVAIAGTTGPNHLPSLQPQALYRATEMKVRTNACDYVTHTLCERVCECEG